MPALNRDLTLVETETFQKGFQLVTKTGLADLVGYTARAMFRPTLGSATIIANLTTENDGIIIDEELSTVTMELTDDAIASIIDSPYKSLVYDIFITSSTGKKYKIAKGCIPIERSVTRDD